MLAEFASVWEVLGTIVSALPDPLTVSVCFVFSVIGVVGILRSL